MHQVERVDVRDGLEQLLHDLFEAGAGGCVGGGRGEGGSGQQVRGSRSADVILSNMFTPPGPLVSTMTPTAVLMVLVVVVVVVVNCVAPLPWQGEVRLGATVPNEAAVLIQIVLEQLGHKEEVLFVVEVVLWGQGRFGLG